MVASKLSNYWSKQDKNGVKVSNWAKESAKPGIALCTYCFDCEVDFKAGSHKLTRHSESVKHMNNTPKVSNVKKQPTIQDVLNTDANNNLRDKKCELEISLIRWASRHNIAFGNLECLAEILKKASDDEVISSIELGRNKCEYVAAHGISDFYFKDLVENIKQSDGISIGFDESAMNKREECELVVKMSHPTKGLITHHYRSIELHQCDAESITNVVYAAFEEEGIDLSNKLVSLSTDGAAVMTGKHSGVQKRFKDLIEDLEFLTSCMDHNINNSMKKATTAFDPDLEDAMVNLYFDLAGAQGNSLKRHHEFLKVARNVGVEPMAIPKMSTTRFQAIGDYCRSALHNFPAYEEYYKSLKKPSERQKHLKTYFVDQGYLTKLKLNFIIFAIKEMEDGINFFEMSSANFHLMFEKIETLLRSQLLKYLNPNVVENIDDEGNIIKLDGKELLSVDVDKRENYLSMRKLKIGDGCSTLLKKYGLTPDSCQVETFMKDCRTFHKTASKQFVHYFDSALNSKVLNYCGSLGLKLRKNVRTRSRIMYLAKKYKRIVNNIQYNGIEQLERELDSYLVDEDISQSDVENLGYVEYWQYICGLQENGWPKYKVLPRFALAMATIFNSNSECERVFSKQTQLSRDPARNRMSQKTLESHLSIKAGVEGYESKTNCKKCKVIDDKLEVGIETKTYHCHCSVAPITQELKDACTSSWRKYKEGKSAKADESKLEKSLAATRKRKREEFEDKELSSFKSRVSSRATFLPPNKMLRVWHNKSDKESKSKSKSSNKTSK